MLYFCLLYTQISRFSHAHRMRVQTRLAPHSSGCVWWNDKQANGNIQTTEPNYNVSELGEWTSVYAHYSHRTQHIEIATNEPLRNTSITECSCTQTSSLRWYIKRISNQIGKAINEKLPLRTFNFFREISIYWVFFIQLIRTTVDFHFVSFRIVSIRFSFITYISIPWTPLDIWKMVALPGIFINKIYKHILVGVGHVQQYFQHLSDYAV